MQQKRRQLAAGLKTVFNIITGALLAFIISVNIQESITGDGISNVVDFLGNAPLTTIFAIITMGIAAFLSATLQSVESECEGNMVLVDWGNKSVQYPAELNKSKMTVECDGSTATIEVED